MPSADLATQLTTIVTQAPLRTLDDLSRDLWKAHGANLLDDIQAQGLAEAIQNRRDAHRSISVTSDKAAIARMPPTMVSEAVPAASKKPTRLWSYFPTKRHQRSPDARQSLERRRTLAATSPLPPKLACRFTTGELAVLKVVSDEVRSKGTCVLSVPELAARAGVGLTKARMALKEATLIGLLAVSERRVPYRPNLTNVIRIVSNEWLMWMSRGKLPKPPSESMKNTVGQGASNKRQFRVPPCHRGQGSLLRRPRNQEVIEKGHLKNVPQT